MRDLAAEFGNISEAIKLPEPTRGYQRYAQTMLGYLRRRDDSVRHVRLQQPPGRRFVAEHRQRRRARSC